MRKNSEPFTASPKGIFLILDVIVGIVWHIAVLAYGLEIGFGPCYGIGVIFGILAVAISLITVYYYPNNSAGHTEIGVGIPVYSSAVYVLISLVGNSIGMFCYTFSSISTLLTLNLALLVLYVAVTLLAARDLNRLQEKVEIEQYNMTSIRSISSQLGILLATWEDTESKRDLYDLKETVDYSNNLSQDFTNDQEKRFNYELGRLQELQDQNADTEQLRAQIKVLRQIWLSRNANAASKQ